VILASSAIGISAVPAETIAMWPILFSSFFLFTTRVKEISS
ncbi:uncharacterized protein METZ01_LOCUS13769, partial [marine metagenome]